MKTILTIAQMEQELDARRAENQKVFEELHSVWNENDQLRTNG